MERQKVNKIPTAILMSDPHLRETTPVCYIGDYQKEQWNSMDFVSNLQKRWNCPILCAGDLFDHWKPSPWLLTETMKHLPAKFFSCMGQHDLPQHSIDLVNKSGFGTLKEAEYIKDANDWNLDNIDIVFCHFGQEPPLKRDQRIKQILIWHKLVYKGEKPFPTASGGQAISMLHKFPQYDLLLFGDNHQTFTATYGDQLLVNPGSLMRMDADQIDHKPCVFLWFAEDNSVQQIFIPIEQGVISRDHIEHRKEHDHRIDAFISKLNTDYKTTLSFEENLESHFKANNTREPVKNIIYKSLE